MRHRFFTLIEMLVVIAIISILASMLSPSLMKALEAARAVACVNNLKQSGLALTTYSNDFGGWIPGSQVYGTAPWSGMLVGSGVGKRETQTGAPIAGNYVGDPAIFYCPSAYHFPDGYMCNEWWASWRYTYGLAKLAPWTNWQGGTCANYTSYRNDNGGDVWINLAAVPRPSHKCLVGDSVRNDQGENYALKKQFAEWEPKGVWDGWSLFEIHPGKVNLWFADNHCAGIPPVKLGDQNGYDVKYVSLADGGPPFQFF